MSSPTTFEQWALLEPLLRTIREIGYETPSPIQAGSIPPLLEGRDLMGQAQTGTGKTAAFALPLLSRIDLSLKQPQILVLTPTRELAIQVAEAFRTYARRLKGFRILPIYGGQAVGIQLHPLKRGVHVVVGTPGRVMDHLRRKTLRLENLRSLVLDEADEMLNMGFLEDVDWILEHTPENRQVALFSATMPKEIRKVAQRHLHDPVEIAIRSKTATVETTTQRYWQVTGTHKLDALTRILEVEPFDAMLIFVRTRNATTELAEKLEARGYACAPLNGDIAQSMREKTVERLKKKSIDILVATDVAARGLDVERISHVVNYDIPYDTEAYVHRIGRTGRAGRKGEAILFVSPRERRMLRAIERATRQPIIEMQLPTRKDISNRRIDQFEQRITETIESQELSFFEKVVEQYQQKHNKGLGEIAAALAYLLQKDRPLLPPDDKKQAGKETNRVRADRTPRGEVETDRYRIEVGRDHDVQPKHIVGALTHEIGIDSEYIGRIKICDSYSTIDLPAGMPRETFQQLKKVRVCGRKLDISLVDPLGAAKALVRKSPRKRPNKPGRPSRPGKPGRAKKPAKPQPKTRRKRTRKET